MFWGQPSPEQTPQAVMEYYLLKQFPGWTLHTIRSMSPRDYKIVLTLCNLDNKIESERYQREMNKAKSTPQAGQFREVRHGGSMDHAGQKPITKGKRSE